MNKILFMILITVSFFNLDTSYANNLKYQELQLNIRDFLNEKYLSVMNIHNTRWFPGIPNNYAFDEKLFVNFYTNNERIYIKEGNPTLGTNMIHDCFVLEEESTYLSLKCILSVRGYLEENHPSVYYILVETFLPQEIETENNNFIIVQAIQFNITDNRECHSSQIQLHINGTLPDIICSPLENNTYLKIYTSYKDIIP
jgi:hypothetical protein